MLFLLTINSALAVTYFTDDGSGTPDSWTDNGATHQYFSGLVHYNSTGSSQYIENSSLFNSLSTSGLKLNISFDFRPISQSTAVETIFALQNNTALFALRLDRSSGDVLQIRDDGHPMNTSNWTLSDGSLYHFEILADFDLGTYNVSVDGSLAKDSTTNGINFLLDQVSAVDRIIIGLDSTSSTCNYGFDNFTVKDQEAAAGSQALNISAIVPTANDHTNANPLRFAYNINTSDGVVDNVTLYINNSVNQTAFNVPDGVRDFNVTMGEGPFTWSINATEQYENESITLRNLVIDYTNPDVTINPTNFFSATNGTTLNVIRQNNHTFNITLSDTYIWAYNITINASNTTLMFMTRNTTGVTMNEHNITNQTNMSTWFSGNYTVLSYVEDDHTSKSIPEWETSKDLLENELLYDTDKGTHLTIKLKSSTLPLIDFSTTKEEDRYVFDYTFDGDDTAEHTYVFKLSSSETLHYRGDLYPYPSFVTGKHWADMKLNTEHDVTYEAHQAGQPNNWEISITTRETDLDFESFGGLNIIQEANWFLINNTPRQAQNLTVASFGPTWINVSWDEVWEANASLLYVDGVQVYNSSTGDLWYNATGLAPGAHQFWVLSYYNESGSLQVNSSSSSENNISGSTSTVLINLTNVTDTNGDAVTGNFTVTYVAGGQDNNGTLPLNLSVPGNTILNITVNQTGWYNSTVEVNTSIESTYTADFFANSWIRFAGNTTNTTLNPTCIVNGSVILHNSQWYTLSTGTHLFECAASPSNTYGAFDVNITKGAGLLNITINVSELYLQLTFNQSTTGIIYWGGDEPGGILNFSTPRILNVTSDFCGANSSCYVTVEFNDRPTGGKQYYQFLKTPSGATVEDSLVVLQSMDSSFFVETMTYSGNPVPETRVRLHWLNNTGVVGHNISTNWALMGQRYTEATGQTAFYVDDGSTLLLSVSKTGYNSVLIPIGADEWVNVTAENPYRVHMAQGFNTLWIERAFWPSQNGFLINDTTLSLCGYDQASRTYYYNTSHKATLTEFTTTALRMTCTNFNYTDYYTNANFTLYLYDAEGNLLSIADREQVWNITYLDVEQRDLFAALRTGMTAFQLPLLFIFLIGLSIAVGIFVGNQGGGSSAGLHTFILGSIVLSIVNWGFAAAGIIGIIYYGSKLLKLGGDT